MHLGCRAPLRHKSKPIIINATVTLLVLCNCSCICKLDNLIKSIKLIFTCKPLEVDCVIWFRSDIYAFFSEYVYYCMMHSSHLLIIWIILFQDELVMQDTVHNVSKKGKHHMVSVLKLMFQLIITHY